MVFDASRHARGFFEALVALDSDEQRRSGFGYNYSIYQVEYSRNLLFRSGAVMQQLFDRVVDRTRSRLDVPAVRTIFGAKTTTQSAARLADSAARRPPAATNEEPEVE